MCHPCEGFPNESAHQAALGTRYDLCKCCFSAGKKKKKNPRSTRICFNESSIICRSRFARIEPALALPPCSLASPTVLWSPTGILPPPGFCHTAPRLKREHLTGSRRKVSAYQNTSRCEELICLGESLRVPPPPEAPPSCQEGPCCSSACRCGAAGPIGNQSVDIGTVFSRVSPRGA